MLRALDRKMGFRQARHYPGPMRNLSILILGLAAFTGCSKSDTAPAGGSQARSTGAGATRPAATTAPAAANGPISVKAASNAKNTAPLTLAFSSAKPSGGDYWDLNYDVTNTGKKDMVALSYKLCLYDKSGAAKGTPAYNGVEVKAKAGQKGTFAAGASKGDLGDGSLAALLVNSVKFSDGSVWEEKMVTCPETAKP